MTENGGNGGTEVRYSVKELLLSIRSDIAALGIKIDQKADKVMVTALETRIAALEDPNRVTLYGRQLLDQFQGVLRDVAELKNSAVSEKTVREYRSAQTTQRNWLIGLACSNAVAIIAIVARYVTEH